MGGASPETGLLSRGGGVHSARFPTVRERMKGVWYLPEGRRKTCNGNERGKKKKKKIHPLSVFGNKEIGRQEDFYSEKKAGLPLNIR